MSDDESGEFDTQALRRQGTKDTKNHGWLIPVLITVAGGVFTYGITSGQNNQRMTELERRSEEETSARQLLATQVANHEVKIAVIDQKLDTIIDQLKDVNAKLERAQQERNR